MRALDCLFHVECFTCFKCEKQLQGQQFYNVDEKPFCEDCYAVSHWGESCWRELSSLWLFSLAFPSSFRCCFLLCSLTGLGDRIHVSCFLWAQSTLEKCSVCKQTITDRMLKATGNSYHPQCFTCVMCHTPLEGTSFIVDQSNQPHCVDDYHRYGEGTCMWCLREGRVPHTCFFLLHYGVGLPM